jgi:hypothetical protein
VSWGDTEDERRRNLENRAMQDFRNAMGGGGGTRNRASLQFPFWFFGAMFGAAEVIDRVFT